MGSNGEDVPIVRSNDNLSGRIPPSHLREPADQQMWHLRKALLTRTMYYQGLDESIEERGEKYGPEYWAETKQADQLAEQNKWHMQQSEVFALLAANDYLRQLVHAQKRTNQLLEALVADLRRRPV